VLKVNTDPFKPMLDVSAAQGGLVNIDLFAVVSINVLPRSNFGSGSRAHLQPSSSISAE
jgi:hypothetical protein